MNVLCHLCGCIIDIKSKNASLVETCFRTWWVKKTHPWMAKKNTSFIMKQNNERIWEASSSKGNTWKRRKWRWISMGITHQKHLPFFVNHSSVKKSPFVLKLIYKHWAMSPWIKPTISQSKILQWGRRSYYNKRSSNRASFYWHATMPFVVLGYWLCHLPKESCPVTASA